MQKFIHTGFTLIELVVTLTVVAILATVAAPSMTDLLDRHRLVGASEGVLSLLRQARSEAIKQGATMEFVISTANQCVGFSRKGASACDCTLDAGSASACTILGDGSNSVLKTLSITNFTGITLGLTSGAPTSINIDGVRGTTDTSETNIVSLSSTQNKELDILINALGRTRMCWPSAKPNINGYKSC